MLFPFRSSSIFRNRWIALLWAAGICFTATEIVDSLSDVTSKNKTTAAASASDTAEVVAALGEGASRIAPPPGGPPALPEQAR